MIYLILTLIGINVKTEVETNVGRLDAVIESEDYIYIIEFKMGTPESAITQIEEREYYRQYQTSGKSIKLIGVGFDKKERNIKKYLIKPLQQES